MRAPARRAGPGPAASGRVDPPLAGRCSALRGESLPVLLSLCGGVGLLKACGGACLLGRGAGPDRPRPAGVGAKAARQAMIMWCKVPVFDLKCRFDDSEAQRTQWLARAQERLYRVVALLDLHGGKQTVLIWR